MDSEYLTRNLNFHMFTLIFMLSYAHIWILQEKLLWNGNSPQIQIIIFLETWKKRIWVIKLWLKHV